VLHTFLPPHFHWWYIPLLFFAGLIGESYGSLVGGGSLITQPALLLVGLPLQAVLAIDTAAPIGTEAGIISGTYEKIVKNKKLVLLMTIPKILGGIIGTYLLLTVSPGIIKYAMAASVFLILLNSFLSRKNSAVHIGKAHYALMYISLFVIAIYTNFIGLGEGTFGKLALMFTLGLTFTESQGLGSASKWPARFYSLVVTSLAGLIVWPYLLTMWCSNFIAGKYATKFSKKVPEKFMRPLMVVVSVAFVVYLLAFY
jgi:uncharacterized protein